MHRGELYHTIKNNYIIMKRFLVLSTALLFVFILKAQEQQVVVPYTLADRDRTIRTEAKMEAIVAKMEALETKMDVKFESIQKQIDQLSMLFYWGFGILITLFIFMLGYMIWDRRNLESTVQSSPPSASHGTPKLKQRNILSASEQLAGFTSSLMRPTCHEQLCTFAKLG